MNLKILVTVALMASCTVKQATTATTQAGPKSCYDYTSPDECARGDNCTLRFGVDALTAEEIFVACMAFAHPNRDCYGSEGCYTNSRAQRVIASTCDYPRWTQVPCTAEELDPCTHTTAEACKADRRCHLRKAKDLTTKVYIDIGCGYIHGKVGSAFSCYTNETTGARAMATSISRTSFPEWTHTDCTEADYEANRLLP